MESLIKRKIAIIGLGYVGLPLAIEFQKKQQVVGYDINVERINELKKGYDSTKELNSKILNDAKNLSLTSNLKDIERCEIFIVTVPSPIKNANIPDFKPLKDASNSISEVLKNGDVVIFESTVYPGATEEIFIPILESKSGLRLNEDFFCGYSPERINPGDKVNTLTKIKKITSGSNDEVAKGIDELYKSIIVAGTHPVSSIKIAEAAKVIENSQRDLNIAFVNELSVIFERLNIDTLEVLQAASTKWNFLPFKPGMVGGHCIGVDPYYLTYKAESVGYLPQVILAGRRINDNMARYVARSLIKKMVKNKINISKCSVGVLGLTFKENCPDIRNSKVIDLIEELKSWNITVKTYDPWVESKHIFEEYGIELSEINETNTVDSLVVAVGHSEFRKINPVQLKNFCGSSEAPVIADVKGIYDKESLKAVGFTVFRL